MVCRSSFARRNPGGIKYLIHVLHNDELFGCLEYDLQAYCGGVDILDFFRKKYSIRKLIMWIRHLPSNSALASRGIGGDGRWNTTEHLLAAAIDSLSVMDYHVLAVNGNKPDKPKPVPRPDLRFIDY